MKIFNDFLDLLNTKRELNEEMEDVIKSFCAKYPYNAKIVYCDNETFSTSYLLILKEDENNHFLKVVFFDQHTNDHVILNFSRHRLDAFLTALGGNKGMRTSI